MADAPLRVFAFDALAAQHAGPVLVSPGVTIAPRRPHTMLNLRGDPRDAAFMRDATAAFGLVLPVKPNTAAGTERMRVLWLGPDEWLLVYAHQAASVAATAISNGTLTDVSHGRAVLRLSGSDCRATFAKVCSLDLDARPFPVGTCAQTALARINVILDHVVPDGFDVYCPRSYAGSLWSSLLEAAAEYGCNIARPG